MGSSVNNKPTTLAQLPMFESAESPVDSLEGALARTVLFVVLPIPITVILLVMKRWVAGLPSAQPSKSANQPNGKNQLGSAAVIETKVDTIRSLKKLSCLYCHNAIALHG